MADPLSIAASLIAVAQISGSIIALCYDYRRSVKGAKRDVLRLSGEVHALRDIVEQLLQLVDVDADVDVGSDDETVGGGSKEAGIYDIYRSDRSGKGMCAKDMFAAATAEEVQPPPSMMRALAALVADDSGNGPINHCLMELEDVEERLRKPVESLKQQQQQTTGQQQRTPRKILGIAMMLIWPLHERDVLRALDGIHRLRGVIELALAADTAGNVLAIHQITQDIRSAQESQAAKAAVREKARRQAARRERRRERRRLQRRLIMEWLAPFVSSQAQGFVARHRDVSSRRTHNTAQWLLNSKEFCAWKTQPDAKDEKHGATPVSGCASSLWLHGIPGCGKTVLASAVIDNLQLDAQQWRSLGRHDSAALGYFYFNFGNETLSLTDRMLRVLLLQLACSTDDAADGDAVLPPLFFLALKYFGRTIHSAVFRYDLDEDDDYGSDSERDTNERVQLISPHHFIDSTPVAPVDGTPAPPTTDELLATLRCCIGELLLHRGRNVYLTLDALDECMDQDSLLQCLEQMLAWDESDLSEPATSNSDDDDDSGASSTWDTVTPGRFRIFVASRHTPEIASLLGGTTEATGRRCSIIATPDVVQPDIEAFVHDQLSTNHRLRRWPARLRDEIQASLTAGARGMFRWADCQLVMLQTCVTVRDVRKALASLPRSLSETYARTLSTVPAFHRAYAVRILLWLAVSPTPLELAAAGDVLAVDLDGVPDGDDNTWGYTFDEDNRVPDIHGIPLLCTTLVRAVSKPIAASGPTDDEPQVRIELRLTHYTVQEYILSDAFFSDFLPANADALPPSLVLVNGVDLAHAHVAQTMLHYLLSMHEHPISEAFLDDRRLARDAAEFWTYHYQRAGEQGQAELQTMVVALLDDKSANADGAATSDSAEPSEAYRNWCRLYDPTKPWRPPQINRLQFAHPLYLASTLGLDTVVSLLLEAGADPSVGGDAHKSCLQAAAFGGHIKVVRALLKAGADPCHGGGIFREPLMAAVVAGHEDVVAELLAQKAVMPDKQHFTIEGTALMQASEHNHVNILRRLVEAGASPNTYSRKTTYANPL